MKLKVLFNAWLGIALVCLAQSAPAALFSSGTYSAIHNFGVLTNVSGIHPKAPLVQDANGALYGVTSASEGGLAGTVFRIQPDGTGFTILKSFSGPVNFTNGTGANPYGGLAQYGTTLYGTTYQGGTGGCGTIFSINTDGTGFTVLTNFASAAYLSNTTGAHPYGGLLLANGVLYGTTQGGGSSGNGTIFQINTNGAGLTVLKNFSASAQNPSMFTFTNSDGAVPDSTLMLAGQTLFGTTSGGGIDGYGTVFAVQLTNNSYSLLHTFTGSSDGAVPYAGLTLAGSTLFGSTSGGGSMSSGTVFQLGTNGQNFSVIYSFSGFNDGANPDGGVILSGGTLYGTTANGGASGFGTAFAVNTNQSGFTNLCSFNGSGSGAYPVAGLFLAGTTLYGSTTGQTGEEDTPGGNGTLFCVNTNGAGFSNLYTFNYSDAAQPGWGLVLASTTLYGTTFNGGSGGNGAVYKVNLDGSGYTVLKSFSEFGLNPFTYGATNSDGASPQGGLVLAGGTLYGTAYYGGTGGFGTLFAVNTNGSVFTNLHNFLGGLNGADPQGSLVLSGGTLYSATVNGGINNHGLIFSISTNGSGFTVMKTFSATSGGTNGDGANPQAGLILANGLLYGTTFNGGSATFGTVFSLNDVNTNFTTLYNFTDGNDGANPYGGLVQAGTSLFGTAYAGGSNNNGTVFALNTAGPNFNVLKTFSATVNATNSDGANPYAGLALSGNILFGTTVNGGAGGVGTMFSVQTNGAAFSAIYTCSSSVGANPHGTLLSSGNALYGTTFNGGNIGDGSVFTYSVVSQPINELNIALSGHSVVLTWTNPAFYLQSAPAAAGVYSYVLGAASPYVVPTTGMQGYFRLATFNGSAPAVTVTPSIINVANGRSSVLNTVATGGSLTYQWELNNGPLNLADVIGATNGPALTISPARDADAGNYTVQVTNPAGTATNATPARLIVLDQPAFAGQPRTGHFTLKFSGPSGSGYHIWSTTDLTLPLSKWSPVTNGQFTAGVNTLSDTTATNIDKFYCVTTP